MAAPPPGHRPVVNFITGNANKLREVVAVLEPAIEVRSQALDLAELQGTMEEVTTDKCKRAAETVCIPTYLVTLNPFIPSALTNPPPAGLLTLPPRFQVAGPVLVEDTCLCFTALGGLPGPYMWVVPLSPVVPPPPRRI